MKSIVENAIAQARAVANSVDFVPVARYAAENSFKRLRPADAMTFHQHCSVVEATVTALNNAGFRAVPVIIDENVYRQWLGEDLNTEEPRARFVAICIARAIKNDHRGKNSENFG